jgi:hypothetical protein
MIEVCLGEFTVNTQSLLPDIPFGNTDLFGRPMLDPFVGFQTINNYQFTLNPNLPEYDRLEILTGIYHYCWKNTLVPTSGYIADYVTTDADSLVYRVYNRETYVFGIHPWSGESLNYIYGVSDFPGAALTVPYYGNLFVSNTFDITFLFLGLKVLTAKLYKTIKDEPCYLDLVSGYALDSRSIPSNPIVTPTESKAITIKYYQRNELEPISDLTSIAWRVFNCDLVQNVPIKLPISNCVMGTLYINDLSIVSLLTNLSTVSGKYHYRYLFPDYLVELFTYWRSLLTNNTLPSNTLTITLRKLAANNNVWNNAQLGNDINFDITHPMFAIDDSRTNNWYISPQTDGSYGNLIMDSPRIIELHTALNATQYLTETPAIIGTGTITNPQTPATHKLDWYIKNSSIPTAITDKITAIWKALGGDIFGTYTEPTTGEKVDRYSNLGWYIQNIARVLGLRVDEKGYIDSVREDKYYIREIIDDPQYDKNAYSKNSFGRYGRLTPHLTNSNGKRAWDKIADIPQMIEAVMEHQNRSLGIQAGTEIEVLNSTTGKKDYYPNQLAMLLDVHAKITEIQLNAKENHNLLQVLSHETRELFSGIGIPVSFKTLWTRYGRLLYVGHQSDKGSVLTGITTLKMNVGMLVGNLLIDRPRDRRNPLERLFSKSKE